MFHNSKKATDFSFRAPNSVFADNAGMIWIGMSDAGLDQFGPATGAFRHFLHTENDPDSVGG